MLAGLRNTVLLSLLVVPLGLFGGLILALLASVKIPAVRWPLMAWVDFFRAFPPLVLLIFLFAGLPFAGLELGGFACVAIAFFLNTGAYYGEILRAGIDSVPAGQVEAARSTGLSRLQAMAYVVLPQAVRNVLPDLLSNTLEVVKLTSLGSVVAVPELLFQARQAQSLTYNPTPIVVAAIIYFLMLWPLVRLLSRLENRALAGGIYQIKRLADLGVKARARRRRRPRRDLVLEPLSGRPLRLGELHLRLLVLEGTAQRVALEGTVLRPAGKLALPELRRRQVRSAQIHAVQLQGRVGALRRGAMTCGG